MLGDMSMTVAHQSSRRRGAPREREVLHDLRRRDPPPRAPPPAVPRRRAGTGRAPRGRGARAKPSSSAARPGAVIQSFASGSAQTASAARPPGRSTRWISRAAASMSGTSISPQRQSTPSNDASPSESAAASSTERTRLPRARAPRPAVPRPSTISGATSVDSSRPPGATSGAARKPVSPDPAARSRTASPGRGSSSSTIRSETGWLDVQMSSRRRSQPAATERQASTVSSRRVYAAAPANCGITCLPYASSVSSCPWVIR